MRTASSPYIQRMEDGIFWVEETPIGSVDGTNKTFTLSYAPNPTSSVEYIVNIGEMTQGVDFTISGDTLTTTDAWPVETTHRIRYRVEPA